MSERWSIRYRPRQFSQVLGQVPVVKFCSHVLREYKEGKGELPVGFLFGGRSGVGKTTLARIVGASLNCESPSGIEPCGECSHCEQIFAGKGGIIEVDASFFGLVDNIRALRDELRMYSVNRYQVVILDEAHMMSKEAFNVLLKLLEEPPKLVMFILCTTESSKILETVRSRLLEFRFTSIPHATIDAYIKKLLEKENVECDPKLYHRLYRLSNNNLRDVIVSLEQLSRLGEGKITKESVSNVYGDVFVFEKVLNALWLGDYGLAVELYQQYADFNTDFLAFLNGFLTVVGDKFSKSLKSGSSESEQYGILFRAIYSFMQTALSLKGEAAARLLFKVILDEVGFVNKKNVVIDETVMSDEEAIQIFKG